MGDLSRHFSRREFACKCGCGYDTVDAELLALCEAVRGIEGAPLTPNSGCRCARHNAAVGGAASSQHLRGRAADLPVLDPPRVFGWLCELYPDRYGLGLYDTFVHVDTRSGAPARWDRTRAGR